MEFDKDYFVGCQKSNYFDYRLMNNFLLWNWKVKETLKFVKRGKLLDIGCAYGYFLKRMPETFQKFGLDISEFAIKEAKKRFSYNFMVGNIEKALTNGWKNFDLITSFDCLEHIQKLDKALSNIKKILINRGFFIVSVPIDSILARFDNDESHCNIFSENEWMKKFKELGFEVCTTKRKFLQGTLFILENK